MPIYRLRFARSVTVALLALVLPAGSAALGGAVEEDEAVTSHLKLPPSESNPRNGAGDFVTLDDGRILLVYSHFTGGGGDDSEAHLEGRFSSDGGRTWTEQDTLILPNEGKLNTMSVSLLRLADGRIALVYLRKNSRSDCRPFLRFSSDEAETWSEPVPIVPDDEPGYYVVNCDRIVQLSGGRLVVPVARHNGPERDGFSKHAVISCYLSDDGGRTWHQSETTFDGRREDGQRVVLQEPGVVELADGRLMMWARTRSGYQHVSYSEDRGATWSPGKMNKHPDMPSPLSPACIKRIPSTGDLLMISNDADRRPEGGRARTPLTVSVSGDEGETWRDVADLHDHPLGWYCYAAIHFADGHVLLGYYADEGKGEWLNTYRVTRFPVDWLYGSG